MSAAAVIGVFSWPQANEAYWLARLCWYCSFWLSIFSLITSIQQRMIEQLPERQDSAISADRVQLLLRLVLRPLLNVRGDLENAKDGQNTYMEPDAFMIYVWQSSMMLMSFSWVSFLAGYALYLLTPFTRRGAWTIEHTVSFFPFVLLSSHTTAEQRQVAIVTIIFGLSNVINFITVNSVFRRQPLRGLLRTLQGLTSPESKTMGSAENSSKPPPLDQRLHRPSVSACTAPRSAPVPYPNQRLFLTPISAYSKPRLAPAMHADERPYYPPNSAPR